MNAGCIFPSTKTIKNWYFYFLSFFLTFYLALLNLTSVLPLSCVFTGYGFVDFDSPAAAQKAVASLKASGVQAQMAKVSLTPPFTLWSALLVLTEVSDSCVAIHPS